MVLWVLIELAIVGCDLQEIVGSAIAFQILFGFPLWLGCLLTFIDTFTFLAIHYFGVRKLEGLFVVLVSIMTICFFINFGKQPPPSGMIAEGFVPQIKPYAVLSAVGLIGKQGGREGGCHYFIHSPLPPSLPPSLAQAP